MPKEGPWVRQQWTLRLLRDRHILGRKVDQGSGTPRWVAHWIEDDKCHQQGASNLAIKAVAAGLGVRSRDAWTHLRMARWREPKQGSSLSSEAHGSPGTSQGSGKLDYSVSMG